MEGTATIIIPVIILVFFFFVIVKDNIPTTRLFDFLQLCHSHHSHVVVVVVVLVFIGVSVDVVVSAMGIVHYCGSCWEDRRLIFDHFSALLKLSITRTIQT